MRPIVYNCIINESEEDETGIYAISFVDCPANETNFIALEKDKNIFLSQDKTKHVLTGVVLRPEQMIYRHDESLGEYYIKFSSEQIEKISQKMMKTGIALRTTTHQHQSPLRGNYLTELWIVEDPQNDKSNALGFTDLPKGTLMCSYKVTPEYWDSCVATGEVKGFSLEGFFMQCKVDLNKSKPTNNNQLSMKKLTYIQRLGLSPSQIRKLEEEPASSGEAYTVFRLEDGREIFVDTDGYVTLDGDPLPAGEHKLDDGNILIVDADNKLVEVKTPSGETKDAQAPETLLRQLRFTRQKLESAEAEIDNKEDEIKRVEDDIERLKKELADREDELKRVKGELTDVKKENTELKRTTPSSQPAAQTKIGANIEDMVKTTEKKTVADRLTLSAIQKQKRNQ